MTEVLVLFAWIGAVMAVGILARHKGRNPAFWGAAAFLTSLPGIIVALVVLSRFADLQRAPKDEQDRRRLREGVIVCLSVILFYAVLFTVVLAVSSRVLSYRKDVPSRLCINNLRLIDHAKIVLGEKNNWTSGHIIAETPEEIWAILNPYFDGTNPPCCPELPKGTHYIYGPIGNVPKCPYGEDHVYEPD